MTDATELILVDGPGAGQRVHAEPNWTSTYLFTSWPDASRLMQNFNSVDQLTFLGPTHTVYRIGHAYNLERQLVRVGWCSGEPQPDPEQLEYWIRFEPPVRVIANADVWPSGCDFTISSDQLRGTVQGVCRCGWQTETVARRRTSELVELVAAHRKVSMAVGFGMGLGALGAPSIGLATRYGALLNRAVAARMSREQAEAIFRDAEAMSYSFDEAITRLEHRLRLLTMYGYMPLTARDVLTQREIETYQIEPEEILNRPRWMPDPLGQQFAEMSHDRRRTLVEAAIELSEQLGGASEGWPLERAVAAVMPHTETSLG